MIASSCPCRRETAASAAERSAPAYTFHPVPATVATPYQRGAPSTSSLSTLSCARANGVPPSDFPVHLEESTERVTIDSPPVLTTRNSSWLTPLPNSEPSLGPT